MLIGIAGQHDNGKDELGRLLAARLGSHWQKAAFAHKVKEVVCAAFGCSLSFIEGWKRRADPPPGWSRPMRDLLQFVGDGLRQWKHDVWLPHVLRQRFRVVCDLRYLNEAEALRGAGHPVILVWRPGFENDDPHPSESELTSLRQEFVARGVRGPTGHPLVGYFVVNDGAPEDMLGQLSPLIEQLS